MKKRLSKNGLFWLVLLLALSVILPYGKDVVQVALYPAEKKLPIYCVQTDKKVVSLTFDAAWGDGYLRIKK